MGFLSSVSRSSKLIEPKEEVVGTSDLQPASQKCRQQPGLATGVWSEGGPGGLSPLPVESDAVCG